MNFVNYELSDFHTRTDCQPVSQPATEKKSDQYRLACHRTRQKVRNTWPASPCITPCLEMPAMSFHVTPIWLYDVATAVTFAGPTSGTETKVFTMIRHHAFYSRYFTCFFFFLFSLLCDIAAVPEHLTTTPTRIFSRMLLFSVSSTATTERTGSRRQQSTAKFCMLNLLPESFYLVCTNTVLISQLIQLDSSHHQLSLNREGSFSAPQMISQPVSSIFPCSPLPSGIWRIPALSIS